MTKEEIIKLIESKFEQAVKEMKAIEGAPLSFLQSAGEVQALEMLLAEIKKTEDSKNYRKKSFAFQKTFPDVLGVLPGTRIEQAAKEVCEFLDETKCGSVNLLFNGTKIRVTETDSPESVVEKYWKDRADK